MVIVGAFAVVAPSLADDNPPPPPARSGPCGGPCPRAKWSPLGDGSVFRDKMPWTDNRIYYARTPAQTERWLPYVEANDRPAIRRTNFSKYGILVVFHRGPAGLALEAIYFKQKGLRAQVGVTPWCAGLAPAPCSGPPASLWGAYVIAKVRKAQLPTPVRLLYISEVADP
jgi:hypothetical protein